MIAERTDNEAPDPQLRTLLLSSTAFQPDGPIPRRYTADGEDVSPPLGWANVPTQARSLALICDDPDAPTSQPFVHWVAANIDASARGLPENVSKKESPSEVRGALQGQNDFQRVGYGGPAPPVGHGVHRYRFRLYALETVLTFTAAPTKAQVLDAMRGHILAWGELVGTYERVRRARATA